MENKTQTPEEILNKFGLIDSTGEIHSYQDEVAIAMIEFGKQQYKQAVMDCVANAEIDCGEERGRVKSFLATDELGNDFGITVDKDSMLKLIKE